MSTPKRKSLQIRSQLSKCKRQKAIDHSKLQLKDQLIKLLEAMRNPMKKMNQILYSIVFKEEEFSEWKIEELRRNYQQHRIVLDDLEEKYNIIKEMDKNEPVLELIPIINEKIDKKLIRYDFNYVEQVKQNDINESKVNETTNTGTPRSKTSMKLIDYLSPGKQGKSDEKHSVDQNVKLLNGSIPNDSIPNDSIPNDSQFKKNKKSSSDDLKENSLLVTPKNATKTSKKQVSSDTNSPRRVSSRAVIAPKRMDFVEFPGKKKQKQN